MILVSRRLTELIAVRNCNLFRFRLPNLKVVGSRSYFIPTMPPKRAAAVSAASKRVRDSSSDSALSSDDTKPVVKRTPVKKAAKAKAVRKEESEEEQEPVVKPKKATKVTKVKEENGDEPKAKKPRAPPKPKAFPPPDLEPSTFPERKGLPAFAFGSDADVHNPSPETIDGGNSQPMHVGAHVSAAGGVAFALLNSGKLGANGLALFLKNQKKWVSKDFEEEDISKFRKLMVSKDLEGTSSCR